MVHKVKITLRGAKPPVRRRLEVPSDFTLSRLHECVQQAFGWAGCDLWVFATPGGEFGDPDPELGHRGASARSLREVCCRSARHTGARRDRMEPAPRRRSPGYHP